MKARKDKRINHEQGAIVTHYSLIKNGFVLTLYLIFQQR